MNARVTVRAVSPHAVLTGSASSATAATTRGPRAQLLPAIRVATRSIGVPGGAGLALLAGALIAVLLWLRPLHREVAQLRAQLARHAPEGRLAGADDAGRLAALLAAMPTRDQLPEILGKVVAQAQAAGLELESGHYEYTVPAGTTLARYELHLPVRGPYGAVRTFADGVLVAVPAAALVGMHLERDTVGSAQVQADLQFAVFVRPAP